MYMSKVKTLNFTVFLWIVTFHVLGLGPATYSELLLYLCLVRFQVLTAASMKMTDWPIYLDAPDKCTSGAP
jgi:hypothetical protein